MNRFRWCLLLAAIPIVLLAQLALSYRSLSVQGFVDRPDGSGAAILQHNPAQGVEVIAWDPGITNLRTIFNHRDRGLVKRTLIASNPSGEQIVVTRRQHLVCIEPQTGKVLWTTEQAKTALAPSRIDFINGGRHLVVTQDFSRSESSSIAILDAESGKAVQRTAIYNVARYLASKNRVAIQFSRQHERFSEWDLIELAGDQMKLIKSPAFAPREMLPNSLTVDLDVSVGGSYSERLDYIDRMKSQHQSKVRLRPATLFQPARIEIVSNQKNKTVRLQSLGFGESITALGLASLAAAIWSLLFVKNGAKSKQHSRLIGHAIVVLILMAVVTWPMTVPGWTESQNARQPAFILRAAPIFFQSVLPSLLSATALSFGLAGILSQRRPFYLWSIFFAACAMPFLLPVIGICVAVLSMGYRFRRPNRSLGNRKVDRIDSDALSQPSCNAPNSSPAIDRQNFRFGILEMMLITAGVAIFIAIGHPGRFLIAHGCLLAGLLALSVLLTSRSTRSMTFCVSVMFVAFLGGGHHLWNGSATTVFVFAIPMLTSLAALQGYRLRATRHPNKIVPAS
ncbi:PQQ-binding-like beta-propeller repeat protein [Planctomycetes bacterium K23_9]|uniref:Uncharacterized protein n=1 Tax=Stieleria marina TaxID=1930275 RepID=A0A517NYC5_9BACT|nr:hypothetical protein K239x_41350 [Planctomycetes bacterium K23_9]